jgi:hypothetical protein
MGGNPAAACACVIHASGTADDVYDDDDAALGTQYTCAYLAAALPDALALGSGGGDCGELPAALSTWLQVSTVLSGLAALGVVCVASLNGLSAFSHRSCFEPVTVARNHDDDPWRGAWGAAGADEFSVEFARTVPSALHGPRGSKSGRFASEAELLF